MVYKVGIITASDKGAVGERIDESGKVIQTIVAERGYQVACYQVVPDEEELLAETMIRFCDKEQVDLILTTGGTGFSKRDRTPEATKRVIDREVPGIPEAMRMYSMQITKRAMLTRATAGIRNHTLIVNLPGSPKAVSETLLFIIDELSHGLAILKGDASECART